MVKNRTDDFSLATSLPQLDRELSAATQSAHGLANAATHLAAALVGGDVSAIGVARFSGVSVIEAQAALALCKENGLMSDDGTVDPVVAARLIADLPIERTAEIRAKAARQWMASGPTHLLAALEQARASGTLLPLEELVDLADRGGRLSLSLHDYKSAAEFLKLSVELDSAGDPVEMGSRLCDLAVAVDGLGDVSEARRLLARAAALAELANDASLMTRAAVNYALPVDWYAGDQRATGLLERAAAMLLTPEQSVMVNAARALVEIRIPVSTGPEHQVAWITRPDVAHALADSALASSDDMSPHVRGLALLAWRTVHRSPAVLAKRREVSKDALNIAQLVRYPSHQVESAVWLAADALESADRPLYDEALSVARWVAEKDGNPRLTWRAHTLSAGAAHLDGDLEAARHWQSLAKSVGESVSSPGWLAADLLLTAEYVLESHDWKLLEQSRLPEDFPALVNPIGRAAAAMVYARLGDNVIADRMINRALRQLDFEGSYLLLATRCTDVVRLTNNVAIASRLIEILEPWESHVAVDSNCWWCDGPVSLSLAYLLRMVGSNDEAVLKLQDAEMTASSMNDARSLRRINELRIEMGDMGARLDVAHVSPATADLTERQRQILILMSNGKTNREIAEALSFSVSTIRLETIAIYRVLQVRSRAEAVAKVIMDGLLN